MTFLNIYSIVVVFIIAVNNLLGAIIDKTLGDRLGSMMCLLLVLPILIYLIKL